MKLNIEPDAPVVVGSVIYASLPEDRELNGTFMVDVFDGEVVFGRMRCVNPAAIMPRLRELTGAMPKSPFEFIAGCMDSLYAGVKNSEERKLSLAQRCALGLEPWIFQPGTGKSSTGKSRLDPSQLRAWRAAVNSANTLALIQGPPGTGKTFVLEQTLRTLCRQGLRILVTAPSNAAVDNICRRVFDLPLLRFGNNLHSIAPDVARRCRITDHAAVDRFVAARKKDGGGIYAGTGVSLLRDRIIREEIKHKGRFDVIVGDEAGMCGVDEFLLCAELADRAVLFGDHQQLPPFPIARNVIDKLRAQFPAIPQGWAATVNGSALEFLAEQRNIPVIMLERSYRCQNPRLLRFSSTLFYDAGVKTGNCAEYYRLPFHEREKRYPPSTMRLYSTSSLPESVRAEKLHFDGRKPGLANHAEAVVCADIFYRAVKQYPLEEISIIAPYRKQVDLLTEMLSPEHVSFLCGREISPLRWQTFLASRISTVDSFQGAESDVIIICYVRSNHDGGIGFVDNPNRINVAHTRCRREMHIVGDIECLKRQEKNEIFKRLEHVFERDGEIVTLTLTAFDGSRPSPPANMVRVGYLPFSIISSHTDV